MSKTWLITTAVEEFWGEDSTRKLFTGTGCLRFSRRHVWENLDFKVIPNPLIDREKRLDTFNWITGVREEFIVALRNALNRVHGTHWSVRYWRMMLFRWLYLYTEQLIDRSARLSSALEICPQYETMLLDKNSWVIPTSTDEFVELTLDDPYNLQIYSELLGLRNLPFPSKDLEIRPAKNEKQPFWLKLRAFPRNLHHSIFLKVPLFGQLLLRNSYFPLHLELWYSLFSAGRMWPCSINYSMAFSPRMIDLDKRASIRSEFGAKGDLKSVIWEMIVRNIPQCFLEGYRELRERSEKLFPRTPKTIFSANSWYNDDIFKHFAASSAEKGTKLVGSQHGHNSGIVELHAGEMFELEVTDFLYTWGWSSHPKCRPKPCNKLLGKKVLRKINSNVRRILFVSTVEPRHSLNLLSPADDFQARKLWAKRFFAELPSSLKVKFVIRHSSHDCGWDLSQEWAQFTGEILHDVEKNFQRSLMASDFLVCDYLGTPFLEAIGLNKPCLKYYDPLRHLILPNAQPFFNSLKEVGIIHESPETAARDLSTAIEDLPRWWNSTQRQKAVAEFRHQYARMEPDGVSLWFHELCQMV